MRDRLNANDFAFHLDSHTGVPVYRQLMDQVQGAIATGKLRVGDQLPTIRQVAVDLSINPNTVTRSYRELEIRGLLETQQGTGTFIAEQETRTDSRLRDRQLKQFAHEVIARAGASGFTIAEVIRSLEAMHAESSPRRK